LEAAGVKTIRSPAQLGEAMFELLGRKTRRARRAAQAAKARRARRRAPARHR
jgi:hypothetical protein